MAAGEDPRSQKIPLVEWLRISKMNEPLAEARITFGILIGGRARKVMVGMPFRPSDGNVEVSTSSDPDTEFRFVHPDLPLVALKLQELAYFVRSLNTCWNHEAVVHFHLSAISSAFYSFFEVLKSQAPSPEARKWAALQKERTLQRTEFLALYKFRNRSTHQGQSPPKLSNAVLVALGNDDTLRILRAVRFAAVPGFASMDLPRTPSEALDEVSKIFLSGVENKSIVFRQNGREVRHALEFMHQDSDGVWREGRPGVPKDGGGVVDSYTRQLIEGTKPLPCHTLVQPDGEDEGDSRIESGTRPRKK